MKSHAYQVVEPSGARSRRRAQHALTALVVLTVATTLTACAGLDARTAAADEASESGIRYYDSSPFLLIYTDGKGGLKSDVLYLPDTTKLRVIKPYAYLAKNDTTLKFEKGRLTQAKSVVDETAVPTEVLKGFEKVALASIKAANAGMTEIPGPYLFRIVKVGDNWNLAGGQAVSAAGGPARIKFTSP